MSEDVYIFLTNTRPEESIEIEENGPKRSVRPPK